MYRKILHCDMNNFYASVELLSRPELRGRMVAVCGDRAERKGIILAKSPEAKAAGVITGETIQEAQRKCNFQLHLLKANFDKYLYYSDSAKSIYSEYSDRVESFGLDECWLDISHGKKHEGDPYSIALAIKNRIFNELGLTISVGLSFNKIFSKLASDRAGMNEAFVISPANWQAEVWPLPVGELLGVGRSTAEFLISRHIRTIGELAALPKAFVERSLGINGLKLWYYANGMDMAEVKKINEVTAVKSISAGSTLIHDINTYEALESVLLSLSMQVCDRMKRHNFCAELTQIDIKYADFSHKSYQISLPYAGNAAKYFTDRAMALLKKERIFVLPVRALTFRVAKLQTVTAPKQTAYLDDYILHNKQETLDRTLYDLRQLFGNNVVKYGVQIEAEKLMTAQQRKLHERDFKTLCAYS